MQLLNPLGILISKVPEADKIANAAEDARGNRKANVVVPNEGGFNRSWEPPWLQ